MKQVILFIWQLPQNIVALIILLWAVLSKRIRKVVMPDFGDGQRIFYVEGFSGGISIGEFIILSTTYLASDGVTEHHEYGHCRQSRMLGPLFLLVIGIPSITCAAFYRYDPADPNKYYRFYTEKWADKLGGVVRK